jgi:hypothetical protein
LFSWRVDPDWEYGQQLPEMPDLITEAREYLEHLHTQRGLRNEIYDLLSQTKIPTSEISDLGKSMDKLYDLKHPLAYKLLTESVPDSDFYLEQAERRKKMLSLLNGDSRKMLEMYPYLKDLARGVVCSLDVKNPPMGKVGVEIEFGLKTKNSSRNISGFNTYDDFSNREISRNILSVDLNEQYLKDFTTLAMYFKDGATHISSLHLHLDRNMHPNKPSVGDMLGNVVGLTVEKSFDKNTWEIRGLLPPAQGNELDPACIADIIQLYISASEEEPKTQDVLKLSEGMEPELEQFIFAHICRFISSPEGRLAALKVIEHPLVLRGVDPSSLIDDFAQEDQDKVYNLFKRVLVGKYAKNSLKLTGRKKGFEDMTNYVYTCEKLTDEEISTQYAQLVDVFKKTHILMSLESGEMGIIGIDGNEYPLPPIETILALFREKSEVLGPKMEQGFRKILVVPFGMRIADLADKYEQSLLAHFKDARLFATKDDENESDVKLELTTNHPVDIPIVFKGSDGTGDLIYYPSDFLDLPRTPTKFNLLNEQKVGWHVLLVENLPNLPAKNLGHTVGGRLQLEAGNTPVNYLRLLESDPMYANEVGMTPEDWLTLSLLHLEETGQVIDDPNGNGKAAYLPGAYFIEGFVPIVRWERSLKCACLDFSIPNYGHNSRGVRVAVRVI